jgi:hypothetical protein
MFGYVGSVPDCRGSDGNTTVRHTGHVTTRYMIYHLLDLYFN